jgi:hypothetical protein
VSGGSSEPPGASSQASGEVSEASGATSKPPGGISKPSGAVPEASGGVSEAPGGVRDSPGGIPGPPGGVPGDFEDVPVPVLLFPLTLLWLRPPCHETPPRPSPPARLQSGSDDAPSLSGERASKSDAPLPCHGGDARNGNDTCSGCDAERPPPGPRLLRTARAGARLDTVRARLLSARRPLYTARSRRRRLLPGAAGAGRGAEPLALQPVDRPHPPVAPPPRPSPRASGPKRAKSWTGRRLAPGGPCGGVSCDRSSPGSAEP